MSHNIRGAAQPAGARVFPVAHLSIHFIKHVSIHWLNGRGGTRGTGLYDCMYMGSNLLLRQCEIVLRVCIIVATTTRLNKGARPMELVSMAY